MNRATDWKRAPGDPKTALAWFFADTEAGALLPSASFALIVLLAVLAFFWSLWMLLAMPIVGLKTRRDVRRNDLSALTTSPSPGPAFECRINVLLSANVVGEGTLLGTDEGVATFVDGWLHVAGRRSDFALRRTDLAVAEVSGASLQLGLLNGRTLMLTTLDARDVERLVRAFRTWLNVTAVPEGQSLFPPSDVHPSGLARAWRDALVSASGLLAFVGFLLALDKGLVFVAFTGGGSLLSFRRLFWLMRLARGETVPCALESKA